MLQLVRGPAAVHWKQGGSALDKPFFEIVLGRVSHTTATMIRDVKQGRDGPVRTHRRDEGYSPDRARGLKWTPWCGPTVRSANDETAVTAVRNWRRARMPAASRMPPQTGSM